MYFRDLEKYNFSLGTSLIIVLCVTCMWKSVLIFFYYSVVLGRRDINVQLISMSLNYNVAPGIISERAVDFVRNILYSYRKGNLWHWVVIR